MITDIDRATCKMLCSEIEEAVQGVAEKHGIQLKRGRAQYGGTTFSMKLEGGVIVNGVVETREAKAFKQMAKFYDMSPDDLGQTFKSGGRMFTITGLNTRASKMPIQAVRDDGGQYKFAADRVKAALAGEAA